MHFWFSGYEIANLREMMLAITEAPTGSPLKVFANGDWFAQVGAKITHGFILPNNPPNKTSEQLLGDFAARSEKK
jgi:hypothetical protein